MPGKQARHSETWSDKLGKERIVDRHRFTRRGHSGDSMPNEIPYLDSAPTTRPGPNSWPAAIDRIGWLLIFIGVPLGNTTFGQAVLLIGMLGRLLTRRRIPWGVPPADRFYVWSGVYLAITLLAATQAPDPLLGVANSLAVFVMIFVLARGSFQLVGPRPYFRLSTVAVIMLTTGLIGSVYAAYIYFVVGRSRALGIATSTNGLGTISTFIALLALGYALKTWRENKYRGLGAAITCVAAVVALVVSFSRGGWLAFAFSLLLFGLLQLLSGRVRWKQLAVAVLVCALVIGVFAAATPKVQKRLLSSFRVESNMDRVNIWRASVAMIKDKPLLGYGGGSFPVVYDTYRTDNRTHAMSFAHNIVLQTAVEYGLLGLAAFSFVIGTALWRGWLVARRGDVLVQSLYAAYVSILVHDMVDNLTHGMDIGGLFWLVTGLFIHMYAQTAPINSNPQADVQNESAQ